MFNWRKTGLQDFFNTLVEAHPLKQIFSSNNQRHTVRVPCKVAKLIQGLMTIGEAACVSVHGTNWLGSNSLPGIVAIVNPVLIAAKSTLDQEQFAPLAAPEA